MDEQAYISSRVDNQINWYDIKSQKAQKQFKWLRGLEIFAAALIPVIAGFGNPILPVELIVGSLGALIVILTGLISLNQLQEKWTEYRTTCESLKHEKYLYLTQTQPYHSDEPFQLFVQRVESIVSKENRNWAQMVSSSLEKTVRPKKP